jgi:hypothetical protein
MRTKGEVGPGLEHRVGGWPSLCTPPTEADPPFAVFKEPASSVVEWGGYHEAIRDAHSSQTRRVSTDSIESCQDGCTVYAGHRTPKQSHLGKILVKLRRLRGV